MNRDSIQQILARRLPTGITADLDFERWLEPLMRRVQVAAQRVNHDVREALRSARDRILEREGGTRTVWHVTGTDGRSLMKSMTSVRSKLGRELCRRESDGRLPKGRMSLDQVEKLLLSFGDLGRFRVVCDLSMDVKEALEELLQVEQQLLIGRYEVRGFKDFVYDLDLREPARGHRAQQFTVEVEEDGYPVLVEIQLMTLLQNAWDRRNHPLYEWHREGGSLPVELHVNDVALAETLHLVDEQATRNWRRFLEIRRSSE
jgi:ppGpp synthetase/RelA/SpoT-type nucleotidyltranferase